MAKFTTIPNLKGLSYQSIQGEPSPIAGIQELGTFTINNRGFWEEINFNEATLQPYLTGNLTTLDVLFNEEADEGRGIPYLNSINNSPRYRYSIDAIPYVIDPNDDDEIIRLDEYYDKTNNTNEYYLTTEGKINYHIYPREIGRNPFNSNIDNYTTRLTTDNFDIYADNEDEIGHFLFKLNWGDGTPLEYTNEPKLLESTVLLDHTYKKPGFYSITGVVYAFDGNNIGAYEKFQTNILLNPSKSYEFNLYNYDNFATIGGISVDSSLVKSAVNIPGIDPIDFNDETASEKVIEDIDLLDRLDLFNFLNKVDSTLLNKFEDFLLPYSQEFEIPIQIYGCMDSNANNYDGFANMDDGLCNYDFNININFNNNGNNIYLARIIYFTDGLPPAQAQSGQQVAEGDFWYISEILLGDTSTGGILNTSELLNDDIPKLFFQFEEQGQPPPFTSVVSLNNQNTLGYRFKLITAYDDDNNPINGWYTFEQINDPSIDNLELDGSRELLLEADINSSTNTDEESGISQNPVTEAPLNTGATGEYNPDMWYLQEEGDILQPDFDNQYTGGLYHRHDDGTYHIGGAIVGDIHDIPADEIIVPAIEPGSLNKYRIILHNSPSTFESSYSKVKFPGGPQSVNDSNFSNMYNGYPSTNNQFISNIEETGDTSVASFTSDTLTLPHPPLSHAADFLQDKIVQIEGNRVNDDPNSVWAGWYYSDSSLITTSKIKQIVLNDEVWEASGGELDETGVDPVRVINLYAKVVLDLEI